MDAENRFLKYQDMICLQKDLAQAIQIENLNRGGQVTKPDNVHLEVIVLPIRVRCKSKDQIRI